MRINDYSPLPTLTTYRKITLGTWRDAGDPSTYTWLDIDVEPAREFILRHNRSSEPGDRIGFAHLVAHAMATALVKHPELNSVIRWRKLFRRPRIDVFHQVLLLGRGADRIRYADQSGLVVRDLATLTGFEQASAHATGVSRTRRYETEAARLQRDLIPLIPCFLIRAFLNISSFFIYSLNLRIPFLGLTEDPFGSFIVSDTAALGAESALMPLPPYTRVGLLVGIGASRKRPWVDDTGKLCVRDVSRLTITFDHRLADGIHLAGMQKVFCECLARPETYFPLTSAEAAAEFSKNAKPAAMRAKHQASPFALEEFPSAHADANV